MVSIRHQSPVVHQLILGYFRSKIELQTVLNCITLPKRSPSADIILRAAPLLAPLPPLHLITFYFSKLNYRSYNCVRDLEDSVIFGVLNSFLFA